MIINNDELVGYLRQILSQEPLDEDALSDWANEWLFSNDHSLDEYAEECRRQEQLQVSLVKPLVGPYRHNPALPALPDAPDGQLHGVGFIYDEDRDDRVLVAIDQLKNHASIVAVAEHKGVLEVYSRLPIGLNMITVCEDVWVVTEFVPRQGRWEEVNNQSVMDSEPRSSKAWQTEPPTAKQLSFLRSLGYTGAEPRTKGEAGGLIGEYKTKKATL